jgi:hypothetical protein
MSIKDAICITVQNTIADLGPMPNECGDKVKKIMQCKNLPAVMALGCMLEDCQKKKAWDSLEDQLKTIPDGDL